LLRAIGSGAGTSRIGAAAAATAAAILVLAALAAARPARKDDRALYTPGELAAIYSHSPLGAPPPDPTDAVAADSRAATLGQFLFFDRNLSADGRIACTSCHQPDRAFTDGRRLAKGLGIGTRHTPSLLNVAFNHWYFWDGRAASLWSQALKPLENPLEFGSDRLFVAHAVAADPALRTAYQQLFGPLPPLADTKRFPPHARPDADPQAPVAKAWAAMTPADRAAVDRLFSNLGKAIEAYERKLVSGNAPFDRYVDGLRTGNPAEQAAISPAAKRGLKLFVGAAHCDLCHSGPAFSDGQFHNLGLPLLPGEAVDPGRAAGSAAVKADPFNGIGAFSDAPRGAARDQLAFLPPAATQLGAFKTPGLRNIALSAPYMHDGRFASLAQVLDFYARGKAASRGRLVGTREATLALIPALSKGQQADLIAFLQTLTGAPLPPALTTAPARP